MYILIKTEIYIYNIYIHIYIYVLRNSKGNTFD